MKSIDFARITTKILGLFWVAKGFVNILQASLLPFLLTDPKLSELPLHFNWKIQVLSSFLASFFYLICGFVLLLKTDGILRILKIKKVEDEVTSEKTAQVNDYHSLAFLVLGLYFTVPALGEIISALLKVMAWSQGISSSAFQMFQTTFLWEVLPNTAESVVKLVAGATLMLLSLKPDKLKSLWKKIRPLSADGKK